MAAGGQLGRQILDHALLAADDGRKRLGEHQDTHRRFLTVARIVAPPPACQNQPVSAPPDPGSSERPTISVVICAFTEDRLDALGEAIDSIGAQSVQPLETVLVIDHAPELLVEARRRWPEIEVFANEEAQGLSGARNTGLAKSHGDVVAFIDDDAVAAPDWLERLTEAYGDRMVVGAGGTVRPRWEAGRPGWFPEEFDWVVGCTHSGMPSRPEPVRNLVGANMSFRRDALTEVGGFSHDLGRIGTLPVGCEETDLCIRIARDRPGETILYDPAAGVEHSVPATRARFGYFTERCSAEGRSKAVLAAMVGSDAGLSSERSYVRSTLPRGFLRGVGDVFRGKPAGLTRSAMIAIGLLTTAAGYARARGSSQSSVTDGGRSDRPPSSALRVLMVTPRRPTEHGGVERHVMEVSRRIAAAGAEVEVLCGDPEVHGVDTELHDGVEIHAVRAWPAKRDWYLAPRLWREIGRARPDLIHIQSYHTLIAPLAMLRALVLGIPYVVTFHGGGHSSGLRNRLRGVQLQLLRPLLSRARRLVAVARFEIDRYGRALGVPPERFVLIPNGTDIVVGESGGGDGSATLATIGRLERYKGHHRVLAAFPDVLQSRPDARLLVVGKGPYESELRRQAEALGVGERVEFTSVTPGDPAAMGELLGQVGLVVLLSDFETHPLVALEAAAAHRRLLVADNGGLGELAEDGFASAIPVDEPPQAVAEAILRELDRPGPTDAPPITSWDECAVALLELYRSIV
jgi:glycosyltransferase involved in cell wall biosynthesis/GT2 family glycosyltransferase